MDYSLIPRALIYKDRLWLEDFGVYKGNTVNKAIVGELKKFLAQYADERMILECLNNTYHICTMALLEYDPVLRINSYIKESSEKYHGMLSQPTLVLVFYYICMLPKGVGSHLEEFLLELEKHIPNSLFIKNLPETELRADEFSPRVIDDTAINDVQRTGFSWKLITDYYSNEYLGRIIETLGKNDSEKLELIKMFRTAIDIDYSEGIYKEERNQFLEGLRNEIIFHGSQTNSDFIVEEDNFEIESLRNENSKLKERIKHLEDQQLNSESSNREQQWIDWLDDDVFISSINAEEVYKTLCNTTTPYLKDRSRCFVLFRVLSEIKGLKQNASRKAILKWWNAHFNCGWNNDNQFKFTDLPEKIKTLNISDWEKCGGNNNQHYYAYAQELLKAFAWNKGRGEYEIKKNYTKNR